MNVIRILLADDHPVVREGLKGLLAGEPDMAVVGVAEDGPTAVTLAGQLDPDVAVVDVSMPGLNGAQVATRLRAERPDLRVLALTVHEDVGYLRLLLGAGASGYVLKRTAAAELVRAVRVVAGGGRYVDPAMAHLLVGGPTRSAGETGAALSEREAEVVRLIALGYSNKEIAARITVSVKTIETYKSRAMEKLKCRGRVDLVRYSAGRGWLTADAPAGAEPKPTRE
ncbi:response regulator [Gemmata sp.]|uniref:response regulator n=1 Tax=Gemmata sp. TaxID=1914242 RepID=UPI003F6F178B